MTVKTILDLNKTDYSLEKEFSNIETMYGSADLSTCSLFAGGYINFGYWKNINLLKKISESERILSEKNLYKLVFNKLEISKDDVILEVGCGLGLGSILLAQNHSVNQIVGIDLSKAQIDRAKEKHKTMLNKNKTLTFVQDIAEKIPYQNKSFSKIFTVEAAQHFTNIATFISEAKRLLIPGGKLVITTFFATTNSSIYKLLDMIPTISQGVDHARPIHSIINELKRNDFKNIQCNSIGEDVWAGFNQWILQSSRNHTWDNNWIKAYRENLIDYYTIVASG